VSKEVISQPFVVDDEKWIENYEGSGVRMDGTCRRRTTKATARPLLNDGGQMMRSLNTTVVCMLLLLLKHLLLCHFTEQ